MSQDDKLTKLLPAERVLAAITHVVALLGYMIPVGSIVIGNVLAPLGMWLGLRNHSSYVEQHARESTNFQISMSLFLFLDHMIFKGDVAHQTIFMLVSVYVALVVLRASLKAFRGRTHKYALSLRYLR